MCISVCVRVDLYARCQSGMFAEKITVKLFPHLDLCTSYAASGVMNIRIQINDKLSVSLILKP